MKPIVLISILLVIIGCSESRPPEVHVGTVDPVAEATIAAKEQQLEAGQAEIARLRGDNGTASKTLDEVRKKLADNALIAEALAKSNRDLKAEGERIVVQGRQTKLYWLSGILGFAALGLGVAAMFSPFFRKTLILASAACAVFAPILLYVARWAAYFEWIGAALLLALAAIVVILWRSKAHALQILAAHFASYADKLEAVAPEARAELDRISVAAQESVPAAKSVIDKALSTVTPAMKI